MTSPNPSAPPSGSLRACGGMPERLNKKDDIVKFLFAHPSWYLECVRGAGLYWWWWIRNANRTYETIHCHGNAATAAIKLLTRHDSDPGSALNEVKWSAWPKIAKEKR